MIDTGSSNLWIPSSTCLYSCSMHPRYDSSSSLSHKHNGSSVLIQYGPGELRGFVSNDVVRIGDLTIRGQDFTEAKFVAGMPWFNWNGDMSQLPQYDGILGLAYDAAAVNHITPPFYNMINHGLLTEPIFSIRLGRSAMDGGELFLGGIDESVYRGEITYLPVRQKKYWEVEITRFGIGIVDTWLRNNGAAVDTGSSMIITPVGIAQKIHQIAGAKRQRNGQHSMPCSDVPQAPELSFYLGETRFSLKGSDYFMEYPKFSGVCISLVAGANLPEDRPQWLLGDPFLRKHFTVYDLEKNVVGFAEARQNQI
ncbi:hypothetical protein AX16_005015 [Volvariella volvacea WC 439]|nr:hypothetical protein AX16_005015 [Volvariella volvacea WC 439]